MQHLCITAPKYGGLYRTFYDIRKTQFFVNFSRHTSAKMKNDRHVVYFYLFYYLFIQYFQRVALLASIASLPSGPL